MSEREFAVALAKKVLDNPLLDPDGDLSVLARQMLRHMETVRSLVQAAGGSIFVSDMHVIDGNDDHRELFWSRSVSDDGYTVYFRNKR